MSAAVRITATLAVAVVLVVVCAAAGVARGASSGPVITIGFPKDGAYYNQGSFWPADYECEAGDAATYVVSCVGDVPVGASLTDTWAGWHTFTVRATDSAGATTTSSVQYNVWDVTPPAVTVATPVDSAVYDVGSVVRADFNCDDGPLGAGIEACYAVGSSTIQNGDPIPTDRPGSFVLFVYGYDNDRNSAYVHVQYQVVDRVPPTISIGTPPAPSGDILPTYLVGQVVLAGYSCSDNYLVASCDGPVPAGQPIDTTTVGLHEFTVDARDTSSNHATAGRSFDVHYAFGGFDSPLASQLATVRAGEKVPVRFSLAGNHGLAVVTRVESRPVSCTTLASTGAFQAAQGSLTYSAGPDRYVLQWQTETGWRGGCRELDVMLDDGTVHRAELAFTK